MENNISCEKSLVVFYEAHDQAENAIIRLQENGIDMKKLSIVGTNFYADEKVVGFYNVGDRIKKWGGFGAFWGGFWGMLFGSAVFFIPGIGPLLIGGPIIGALLGALEGATVVGGITALGAALVSIGIPKHKIIKYETEIQAGKFMLLVHGAEHELEQARVVLDIHIPKPSVRANQYIAESVITEKLPDREINLKFSDQKPPKEWKHNEGY